MTIKNINSILVEVDKSNGEKQEFDPQKIYENIIRETGVLSFVSYIIANRVWRKLISQNPSYISSPEIREMVCSCFVDLGIPAYRLLYTRIGMPFYEINKIMCNNGIKEDLKIKGIFEHTKYEYTNVVNLKNKLHNLNRHSILIRILPNLNEKELEYIKEFLVNSEIELYNQIISVKTLDIEKSFIGE